MGLEARVNERTRIARELHDTLLQSFQGLMLRFQTVDEMLPARPLDAKKALEGALNRADQALIEGRDAITDMRASTWVGHDLEKSMTALMTKLNEELVTGGRETVTFSVSWSRVLQKPCARLSGTRYTALRGSRCGMPSATQRRGASKRKSPMANVCFVCASATMERALTQASLNTADVPGIGVCLESANAPNRSERNWRSGVNSEQARK